MKLEPNPLKLSQAVAFLAGGILSVIVAVILVGVVAAVFGENNLVVRSGKFIALAAFAAGAIEAKKWWIHYQAKKEAALPWNQKRKGGPILPGASPEFLQRVQERK